MLNRSGKLKQTSRNFSLRFLGSVHRKKHHLFRLDTKNIFFLLYLIFTCLQKFGNVQFGGFSVQVTKKNIKRITNNINKIT
jgi:hypothetical protein